MMPETSTPYQDAVIGELAAGLHFADVGGLWGTVNEKISVALASGAASASLIDIVPDGHELWQAMRSHLASKGLGEGWRGIPGQNLDEHDLASRVGQFDFVHCAGIVYHAPDPLYTLRQLASLTRKYLLVGSMVAPERMTTTRGDLDFSGGQTTFVPALSGHTLDIVRAHFATQGIRIANLTEGLDEAWIVDGMLNYGPWWWLFSATTLRSMLEVSGLRVISHAGYWENRVEYVLCERV